MMDDNNFQTSKTLSFVPPAVKKDAGACFSEHGSTHLSAPPLTSTSNNNTNVATTATHYVAVSSSGLLQRQQGQSPTTTTTEHSHVQQKEQQKQQQKRNSNNIAQSFLLSLFPSSAIPTADRANTNGDGIKRSLPSIPSSLSSLPTDQPPQNKVTNLSDDDDYKSKDAVRLQSQQQPQQLPPAESVPLIHARQQEQQQRHRRCRRRRITELQGNLMRELKHRDPMKIYEVLEVLGEGSLGRVCRVRKRLEAVGGSANPRFVLEHKGCCFHFLASFHCRMLRSCWGQYYYYYRRPSMFGNKNDLDLEDEEVEDDHDEDDDDDDDNILMDDSVEAQLPGGTDLVLSDNHTAARDPLREPGTETASAASSCEGFAVASVRSGQSQTTANSNNGESFASSSSSSSSSFSGPYGIHVVCQHPHIPTFPARTNYFNANHQYSSSLSSSKQLSGRSVSTQYALKSIHLSRCRNQAFVDELRNEVDILKELDHPNIVRAIETFDYKNRLYLVLELCQGGGDLYTRDPYPESVAQSIMHCLCSAVAYLHRRGIVHRDLKFENVMFVNWHSNDIKLIDFGLSQKFVPSSSSSLSSRLDENGQHQQHENGERQYLHDPVGTIYTMAPELLSGDYTHQVDVWSLGVIAFMLLSSSLPFYGQTRVKTIQRILKGRFRFLPQGRWDLVSDDAKAFCEACLTVDPDKRPTARQAQQYPWLQSPAGRRSLAVSSQGTLAAPALFILPTENEPHLQHISSRHSWSSVTIPTAEQMTPEELDQLNRVQLSIQAFAGYSHLKKLALMIVAYKSTSDEIGFLKQMFDKFDLDRDGEISRQEFTRVMSSFHNSFTESEIQAMFNGIDVDGTDSLQYSEFLAATLEALSLPPSAPPASRGTGDDYGGFLEESRLAEAFDRLDCDDSGYITLSNLSQLLGPSVPQHYVRAVLDEVTSAKSKNDTDQYKRGDPYLSYEQFRQLLLSSSASSNRTTATAAPGTSRGVLLSESNR